MVLPDKLLVNLRILSKIEKNGRICRSRDGIVALERSAFYQSLKRFITSDSRKQSVSEIKSIVSEAFECIANILSSRYLVASESQSDIYYKLCEELDLLVDALDNSRIGIENLKFTYSNDPNTASQLDILIIKINSVVRDTKYKLQYHKTNCGIIEEQNNPPNSPNVNQDENEHPVSFYTTINNDLI